MPFKIVRQPYQWIYRHHQPQIDELRALGTREEDMLELLIYTQDYKMTLEDARKAIIAREEAKNCPHCGKELNPAQAQRYRNRHVNACQEKMQASRTQIQTSEQNQPASPSESSASTSSSTSPKPTTSNASSFSPPSHSPKRKADDETGLSSEEDRVEETTEDNTEQEQSGGSPSAKRPKLAEYGAHEPIIGKALFKKQPGTIDIDMARKFVTWQPDDRTIAQTMAIRIVDLINYQRSVGGSASKSQKGLVHKIISRQPGEPKTSSYVFKFPSTDDGQRDSEAISDVLTPIAMAARSRDDDEGVVFENVA